VLKLELERALLKRSDVQTYTVLSDVLFSPLLVLCFIEILSLVFFFRFVVDVFMLLIDGACITAHRTRCGLQSTGQYCLLIFTESCSQNYWNFIAWMSVTVAK
jgi:hypothetical protein